MGGVGEKFGFSSNFFFKVFEGFLGLVLMAEAGGSLSGVFFFHFQAIYKHTIFINMFYPQKTTFGP